MGSSPKAPPAATEALHPRLLTLPWSGGPLAQAWRRGGLPIRLLDELDAVVNQRFDLHTSSEAGGAIHLVFSGLKLIAFSVPRRGERFMLFRYEGRWFDQDGFSVEGGFLARPVELARVTSPFGMRLHPITKRHTVHKGVDYGAPSGTPVYAVAAGTVLGAQRGRVAGRNIRLLHRDGFVSRYLHLEAMAEGVSEGASVKLGQTIGYVGNTGRSTGPHLHFELWQYGRPTDPLKEDRPRGPRLSPLRLRKFHAHIAPLKELTNATKNPRD